MPYLKPLPAVTEPNLPFWDALKQHAFLVPKCDDCDSYNWTPYPACRNCLSEKQTWTKVSGEGTLYTYTVVHRGPGAFGEEVPYIVAVAELKEKPLDLIVMSNLIGIDPDDVQIGMPVKIVYEDIPEEDATLWRFAPA
jgi:uncharacterized OB-fold protein